MRAARLDARPKKRPITGATHELHVRDRQAATPVARGHDVHAPAMLREVMAKHAIPATPAAHRDQVFLLDGAPFELLGDRTVRLGAACVEDDARRVAIETLMDPEIRGVFATGTEPHAEPRRQVIRRARVRSLARDPGRLVDDQQIVVFVEDAICVEWRKQRRARGTFEASLAAAGCHVSRRARAGRPARAATASPRS